MVSRARAIHRPRGACRFKPLKVHLVLAGAVPKDFAQSCTDIWRISQRPQASTQVVTERAAFIRGYSVQVVKGPALAFQLVNCPSRQVWMSPGKLVDALDIFVLLNRASMARVELSELGDTKTGEPNAFTHVERGSI